MNTDDQHHHYHHNYPPTAASGAAAASASPPAAKRESSSSSSSLDGRGGLLGKSKYKLWMLAAILLLAFWTMFTGSVTLKWSAGNLTRLSDRLFDTPLYEDLDVLVPRPVSVYELIRIGWSNCHVYALDGSSSHTSEWDFIAFYFCVIWPTNL